eukprot:3407275-Rhodomonas_salina.1
MHALLLPISVSAALSLISDWVTSLRCVAFPPGLVHSVLRREYAEDTRGGSGNAKQVLAGGLASNLRDTSFIQSGLVRSVSGSRSLGLAQSCAGGFSQTWARRACTGQAAEGALTSGASGTVRRCGNGSVWLRPSIE